MRQIVPAILMLFNVSLAGANSRILCYERFDDQIYELSGELLVDDVSCQVMLVAGTVGGCFQGDAASIADQMNSGMYEYSSVRKVNRNSATVLSEDIIQYGSYEGDLAGWTRDNNEIFRCPEFDKIKEDTTQLALALGTSVDYAVARRYREEFGLPFWPLP